jgi:hypothetical protein
VRCGKYKLNAAQSQRFFISDRLSLLLYELPLALASGLTGNKNKGLSRK